MVCPNCKKSGNVFKRIFVKRSYGTNRYCIYCNSEVSVEYNWLKILVLGVIVLFLLILAQVILHFVGLPGMNSGVAGGIAGAIIAISIRRYPFVEIKLIKKSTNESKR